ncbi:hypothetical protein L208DRAFT_1475918 [Tricholoma matsutake]|nr:hypothetical protein L208DRAFT_1475918 [Tricholoma matsutake 945]
MSPPASTPEFNGRDLSGRTDWRKFIKLDCMDGPGLTEDEFWGLFVKCDACVLITMHLMFCSHHCDPHMADELDLTDQE